MRELAWVNGVITDMTEAKVSFLDHGYFYGFGVYEALKTYSGRPFAVKEHMDRLDRSLDALGIKPNVTREELIQVIYDLVDQSQIQNALIYLQITRGVGPRTHTKLPNLNPTVSMFVSQLPPFPEALRRSGIKTILVKDDRWAHPHIKTLNLLPNILAKQAADEQQAQEAILFRDNGNISEAASSNVFAVFGNTIVTPPTDGRILNGVTRLVLLELLAKSHYEHKEDYFTAEDILNADEVFITNTGSEVLSVTQIGDKRIGNGVPGRITQALYELFMQEVPNRI